VSFHLSAWPARNGADNGPIKRSTIREMHTPQFNFLNTWNRDWDNEPCTKMIGYGYGLGIAMDCKRITRISHGGALPGFGSNYAFFPNYGIGIMAFGNLTYTTPIPYDTIEKLLFGTLDLKSRKLPVSDILKQRKNDILDLIDNGTIQLDAPIFADNFFLDESKEKRMAQIQEILNKAGTIKKSHELRPRNQLRGDFNIECENGDISIFFTLTPEHHPMVQRLDVSFSPKEN
ncbi:MAG: serine hydrolase, partial [Bacteroidota bacterium]